MACSQNRQASATRPRLPCNVAYVTWGLVVTSRSLRGRKLGAQRETTAYFESLDIKKTSDVVRHLIHTASLSADLVRGPGGSGEMSQATGKAVQKALKVCKSFLPKVLRDQSSVSQILDLLCEALALAGHPSSREAFAALEKPLVSFHEAAPLAMRKALQARFATTAEPWMFSKPCRNTCRDVRFAESRRACI